MKRSGVKKDGLMLLRIGIATMVIGLLASPVATALLAGSTVPTTEAGATEGAWVFSIASTIYAVALPLGSALVAGAVVLLVVTRSANEDARDAARPSD
jgi:hypothetical protein